MRTCPKCNIEIDDTVEKCPSCRAELSLELAVTSEDAPDVRSGVARFIFLRAYPSQIHARMVAEALEGAGIPHLVKSNEMFGAGTGLGSFAPTKVEIWVPTDRLTEARGIADATLDPV